LLKVLYFSDVYRLRSELKYRARAGFATIGRRPIEVARRVPDHPRCRTGPVRVVEAVQYGLRAGVIDLEYRSVIIGIATTPGGAVEIAG
jgi:hypothetical protein